MVAGLSWRRRFGKMPRVEVMHALLHSGSWGLPTALELGVMSREKHRELLGGFVDERGSWSL